MDAPIGIGIVGFGKIAREQHVPALRANSRFRLLAVASKERVLDAGVPSYTRLEDMLRDVPQLKALAFCMPAQQRSVLVKQALESGFHVLLEKPPGATVGEVMALKALAVRRRLSLYASWHSRHGAAVELARGWLENQSVQRAHIEWKEDVRKWHPGQEWLWQLGGLGVFDPGINALSILTHLLPGGLFVKHAALRYPVNRAMPIAATVELNHGVTPITAEFDFLHSGEECWTIQFNTDAGCLRLEQGGSILTIDGVNVPGHSCAEYSSVYRHFEQLINNAESDVDITPLQLVADAFFVGSRESVAPFHY